MTTLGVDEPTAVRDGEGLPEDRLLKYLEGQFPGVDELTLEQFPSGFSNLTYRVSFEHENGREELVLRRPPFGSTVRSAHDMGREFRILSGLATGYPKAPRPVAYCEDDAVLGAPFYLMRRVRGLILRGRMTVDTAPSVEAMRAIAESFVGALAELHDLDFGAAGLAELGKPEGYARRQVEGWLKRWERSKTDDVPDLERAGRWLASEVSTESGHALVHNDFKYDNVVLDPDAPSRILAILDWEMATIGDPVLDLGTTLAYWVEAGDPEPLRALGLNPTTLPGNPGRREVAEQYAQLRDLDGSKLVFAYVFGLTKIAVIVQQIYARYRAGHTSDPRFAALDDAVRALGWAAARAIELGRIDRLDA